MDLQHLRTFVAVAEARSLTRAAERLHLSQPAVSGQLKALEEDLGVPLFVRTGRGVTLTAPGSELLAHACDILTRVAGMSRRGQELSGALPAAMTLGVMDCGYDLKLARIVGQARLRLPRLKVELVTNNSSENIRAVLEHAVDLAFVEGRWDDPRIETWELGTSRIGIIAPAAWRERLTGGWPVLADVPWVFQGPGCSHTRLLGELCETHHVTITPEYRAEAFGAVKDLVREGLAVSMADLDEAAPWIESGEVFAWEGFERRMPVLLTALRQRASEPALAAFVETALAAHRRPRLIDARAAGL